MKHLTMADKSLLVDDTTADLLLEYAALLARTDSADTVVVNAYGDDGDPVAVTFLLNSGISLLAETSESRVPEPENAAAIRYIEQRIQLIQSPPLAQPMAQPDERSDWELSAGSPRSSANGSSRWPRPRARASACR